jgi:hypothetical protein
MPNEPTLNSEPSSAIARLGHVLSKKTPSPRYQKSQEPINALVCQYRLRQVLAEKTGSPRNHMAQKPTSALVCHYRLGQVLAEKPRSPGYNKTLQLTAVVSQCWTQECAGREAKRKKSAKAATSVPICFQGSSMVNHRGAGLCLAVTKSRTHKYSSNAVYPSCAQAPSVLASMGRIGHDSQEGCQAQAKLNRYLCRLATQELRVSFDRRPDMQLERPRNLQLHTPQHLDLCGHGTSFARLSEGCQALAELNRYHCRLARHELLGMRGCSMVKVQVQVQVQEGVVEEWRPVTAIQVTPFGVIECVETPLLPPACQSRPGDSRWSQQGLDTRARPLPCRREWVSRPRSLASASLMGKGKRSRAALFPRARPVPCRWVTGRVQGGVDPRGSAIALLMGFPGARPLPRRWGKKKASRVWLIPKARPLPCRWK